MQDSNFEVVKSLDDSFFNHGLMDSIMIDDNNKSHLIPEESKINYSQPPKLEIYG